MNGAEFEQASREFATLIVGQLKSGTATSCKQSMVPGYNKAEAAILMY